MTAYTCGGGGFVLWLMRGYVGFSFEGRKSFLLLLWEFTRGDIGRGLIKTGNKDHKCHISRWPVCSFISFLSLFLGEKCVCVSRNLIKKCQVFFSISRDTKETSEAKNFKERERERDTNRIGQNRSYINQGGEQRIPAVRLTPECGQASEFHFRNERVNEILLTKKNNSTKTVTGQREKCK